MIRYIKNNIQKLLDYGLIILVFLVPWTTAYPNLMLVPCGLLYIIKIIQEKKIKLSYIWLMHFLLIVLILFLALIDGHLLEELSYYRKFISGLFVFLLISETTQLRLIEKSFVFGLCLCIIINLINILYQLSLGLELDFSYGSNINQLLLVHRPYLAFMTVLANCILYKWIRNKSSKVYYVLCLCFLAFTFFITARLGILLHVIILLYHIYSSIDKFKLKHIGIMVLIFAVFSIVIVNNPFLKERMRIDSTVDKTIEKYKAYEIRYIIWMCSAEALETNWLLGIKSHETMIPLLTNCYVSKINPKQTKKVDYYKSSKFNTHNQYFDFWLVSGLIGIILFCIGLLYPYLKPSLYDPVLLTLTLFIIFFLVENVFYRQLGCYMYGIFFGLYTPREFQFSWLK